MKRWQKFSLVLALFLVVTQAPFAYRRYQLGKLHAAIQSLQSQRVPIDNNDEFTEFRGVTHVHSFLGGHSTGTFQSIIAGAQSNQLNFVLMSEHPAREFDTAGMTLQGEHGGVLFIAGNEVSTASGERLLLFPGYKDAVSDDQRTVEQVLSSRRFEFAVAAYPNEFRNWQASGYDAVEVYNVFTNTALISRPIMFFDGLWSYRSYPDLLFARFYQRPGSSLGKWDEAISQRKQRIAATAGNDAHANVGLDLRDSSGQTLFGIQLDPYERSFRLVRMHILLRRGQAATQETVLTALKSGNSFIGFDVLGDASGFRFTADDGRTRRTMGEEINLSSEIQLSVRVPLKARIQVLRDGSVIKEVQDSSELGFTVKERGAYRVEVYLPQLPVVGTQPWIISNPIYVR